MSRIPIASLVFAAGVLLAPIAGAMIPFTPEDQPVVLGEWHNSYAKTRELAFSQEIPIVVIWGSTTCGYCDSLDRYISTSTFINWRQERKLVMLYAKNTSTANNTSVKTWAKNDSLLWPYVLVNWKGNTWKFTGRYSGTTDDAKAQKFIDQIESYIHDYTGPGKIDPPATDGWDTGDDAEAGATRLAMLSTAQSSKPHYLNKNDTADWFRFTNLVADAEYRVWLSDFAQEGAGGLTATFYRATSATPLTNLPLASLVSPFVYTAANADNLLLKIRRNANTNATVSYALNYRKWVPCTIGFDTNAVSVSESAKVLLVPVRRSTWNGATSAWITFSNGTATAGADYVGTPTNLVWTAGGADVLTARVALISTDTVWEGNETFTVTVTPDPATALPGPIVRQTVTILEKSAPTAGQLAYTAYQTTGAKTALSSTTKIATRESAEVSLWLSRTGGTSLEASANFVWSDGSDAPASLKWASLEGGEKQTVVTVPPQDGYQPVRTLYLDFTATGATAASGKTRATLTVTDEAYLSSLAAYVAQNPSIPFKTTSDAWFRTADDVLRCAPPSATGSSVMTASLTGPGVLVFTGAKSDSGAFTLTVGSRAAQTIATDGSRTVVAIPSGRQTATWRFARDGGSDDQSFASISDPSYVRVPAVTPVAPVAGSVVRQGPVTLRWADAFAGVREIDGVVHEYRVYAGRSSTSMTQVGGVLAALSGAKVAEPVTSATVDAAAGSLYWRVDLTLGDGANTVVVRGTSFSAKVVGATAPAFAVTEENVTGQEWFTELVDGATLKVALQAGVRTAIGPLPADNGTGTLAVSVKSGSLPSGLALSVENGAVWLKGVPSKAGSGTALLQASRKVGYTTTAGTTLALVYTVAALPAGTYGTFNGDALYEDGVAKPIDGSATLGQSSMTVATTGKSSGKFVFAGRTYAFTAAGYDFVEDGEAGPVYWITNGLFAVYGTSRVALAVAVSPAWPGTARVQPPVAEQAPRIEAEMNRNGWRDSQLDERRQAVIGECAGYYTAILPDNDPDDEDAFGSGYLTLTVSSAGAVTVGGKLADGTSATMSGTLLLDGDGNPYTVLFLAPSAYQGGFFFARIDFNADEGGGPVTLSGTAVWRSDNPQATGEYGAGFERVLEVQGGYFSKTETLDEYYSGTTDFEASVETWDVPVPLGLNAPNYTNFTVPAGGSADNPVYLSLTASRTTGLLSGSFREYSSETAYATRSCYGVLTPYLAVPESVIPVAARGFFLRPQSAVSPNYTYSESVDFLVTGCDGCGD